MPGREAVLQGWKDCMWCVSVELCRLALWRVVLSEIDGTVDKGLTRGIGSRDGLCELPKKFCSL